MRSKRWFLLMVLSLVLAALACRFSAPTPVSWLPTTTALAHNQTQTALSERQTASPVAPTSLPTTATPTALSPTPTLIEDGPWLVFPNEAGTGLYALDRDTGSLYPIDLPALVAPGDVLDGRAPNGSQLLVRAGNMEELDELAFYRWVSPHKPPDKVTPLLSVGLQQAIINQDKGQALMALRAVQQPHAISWSKDSKMAVFSAALHGQSSEIYLYKPATDSLQRLTARYQQDISPLWSPGLEWVVFQEVDTYLTPNAWEVSLVAGLSMPDNAITRFLYVPSSESVEEIFAGWTNELYLLSYTKTEQGGKTLRLTNIKAGKPTIIFSGAFKNLVLDPATGDIALYVDPESARQNEQTPGIYYSQNGGVYFHKLLEGEYDHLNYSSALGHFWVSRNNTVIEFNSSGIISTLLQETRVSYSPNANWIIAYGENGARLYSGEGTRLQILSQEAVETVIWQENSQGFYLLQADGLYQRQFPLLQPQLLCADVYRQDEALFIWLTPN
ncbi:MAG: hypothetical protein WA116_01185 [Anaerolineaceae bacterium]